MNNIKNQSIALRKKGLSTYDIAKTLNKSQSVVHRWVRDVLLSNKQKDEISKRRTEKILNSPNRIAYSDKCRENRLKFQNEGRELARQNIPLHIIGCMLYWAEGQKRKSKRSRSLEFANSDPHMIKLYVDFLKHSLDVETDRIKLYIRIYPNQVNNKQKIEEYWLKLVGIPKDRLGKTHILKRSTPSRKTNIHEYGHCTISVYSTNLIHHVLGAIQEYGKFDRPEWLESCKK